MPFTIKVNGTPHTVDVDGDTPLLWVLRDLLGMTGTKFGCGAALCGACTVHVDGAATRSCITTIDSIGNGANDPGATNVAQIVISGTKRHTPKDAVSMPAFGNAYSDAEIAAVANYVTSRFGSNGSQLTAQDVAELRKQTSE
jgi:succinate dehydrogenase/fumarate reductase-like Fe-S protein